MESDQGGGAGETDEDEPLTQWAERRRRRGGAPARALGMVPLLANSAAADPTGPQARSPKGGFYSWYHGAQGPPGGPWTPEETRAYLSYSISMLDQRPAMEATTGWTAGLAGTRPERRPLL